MRSSEPTEHSAKLRVEIPDLGYWKRPIGCQDSCPVHTDARGCVRAIATGHDEIANLIARGPNPLASICGRVCGAPCEDGCRRGEIDRPIAIRALKRVLCGRFGPEARAGGGAGLIAYLKEAATRLPARPCQDVDELLLPLRATLDERFVPVEGQSVDIIGSGPAGLAAAHDLLPLGFAVTLYHLASWIPAAAEALHRLSGDAWPARRLGLLATHAGRPDPEPQS